MRTEYGDEALPPDDADELSWLRFRQQHVISRQQALRYLTAKAVRAHLAAGRWQQATRGVYVTHSGPLSRHQRRWIAVLATGSGVLAGTSALESAGLRGHRFETTHVLIPAGSRDRDPPPGVMVHRTSRLPPAHIHRVGSPPATVPARSLVDAAQWVDTDERARILVAACFQQRLVGYEELAAVLTHLPRARRRALVRETALDAVGGAHSLPEAEFLRLCRRAGLPAPTRQVRRRDSCGRWRYLDVYFAPWRLHVEIDGGQHMEVRQWWADMRRQNDLWIPGDRVLRFPSWAIRHRPHEVVAQVRAALIAAGWSPDDLGRPVPS